jgi:hypothetical protein
MMVRKKDLLKKLEDKDKNIQELLRIIADKDKQIVELLVELGDYYQDEIERNKNKENNQ